ncbi:4'-phosphopantetheinyl transferase superfamily protein [Mesorhizobium sp. WSM4904]|uniref:4'-phosphopantetheinyl transferase family protein n=1 Tax=Mesorhizobium sp. WSM4904 TaxID=3038545 RepID=UPI0024185B36|nr:4'-phosphopantetheinyl transferase superfamily protein [Mesorhizobium sp. WSM4904]WFP63577.1 4'-phosphopantetheinyl transferase superfamily protein [Mesorhizobium sp. WSM4904]
MDVESQNAPCRLESAVAEALNGLALPRLLAGCRRIRDGDAQFLLPAESASIAKREHKARAASGAGRRVVHELLQRLGCADLAVTRGRMGDPVWPPDIVGSIAHDDELAVAVAARTDAVRSVGVDIEPALPLPPDLLPIVITPQDRLGDLDPLLDLAGRILFAAKEATYKASFPLDGRVLGFEDIAVDLETGEAATPSGRRFMVGFTVTSKILALAYTA